MHSTKTKQKLPEEKFAQFAAAYPSSRRQTGVKARNAFAQAIQQVPFAILLHALEQHARSAQWQDPRFIPNLTTWLLEGRWCQVLPEPTPQLSPADQAQRRRSLSPQEQLRRLGVKR
jgi:hypothetical protein